MKPRMTICVSFLLCAVFCQAASTHKGEGNSEIDFKTMHSEQVVSLFQKAGELKVKGKGAAGACNGKKQPPGADEWGCLSFAEYDWEGRIWKDVNQDVKLKNDLQTKTNAQLFPFMAALVRGCAVYAPSPDKARGMRTCVLLARVFLALGNEEAATAVWEFAPGCSTYRKGVQVDVCFGPAWTYVSDKGTLKRIARKTCDTLHDRTACEYLANRGEKVDMDAVQQAEAQAVEDRQAYKEEVAEKIARADAEANRPSTLLTVLQGMPGANDPNAIVNAGNQQAAAMRAIGNANAAAQQQVAQARVAAQQATEQAQLATAQQVQGTTSPKSQLNGTPSGNSGTSAATGSPTDSPNGAVNSPAASSATGAARYASPLPYSCIRQFWDPQVYNWLSFENDCGVAVNLNFVFNNATGWAMNGSMALAPGAHKNTGLSGADVNKAGGFKYYVCPDGYIPVDANNNLVNNSSITEFRCKSLQ